nr:uncharacterized protein LOC131788969 [Pocillopora verrucosa]
MEAGTYTPWEPGDLSHMTVDRCTEHCCKSPDTDVVFLLNSYCFCVKCHSLESCAMVKITPPSTYRPVIVTVLKRNNNDNKNITSDNAFLSFLQLRNLFRLPGVSRGGPNLQNIVPNQPPSNSNKKKQKELKDPKMPKQIPPRRRVIVDSDEEMGPKSARNGDSQAVRKLFRFFSRKHNPQTALVIRYAICFFLGGLVGLIPYLVFVIELCKANLEMRNPHLPSINGYSKHKDVPKNEALTSFSEISSAPVITTAYVDVNFTTLSSNSTGITTPRPTRVVTTEKKAEGTGNDDISLQCSGTITVIRVRALGIPGDTSTVDDFNKHCQANLGQVDGTNVCIVSLKRVYKSRYPPFIKTVVTYTCSYTEEIS